MIDKTVRSVSATHIDAGSKITRHILTLAAPLRPACRVTFELGQPAGRRVPRVELRDEASGTFVEVADAEVYHLALSRYLATRGEQENVFQKHKHGDVIDPGKEV